MHNLPEWCYCLPLEHFRDRCAGWFLVEFSSFLRRKWCVLKMSSKQSITRAKIKIILSQMHLQLQVILNMEDYFFLCKCIQCPFNFISSLRNCGWQIPYFSHEYMILCIFLFILPLPKNESKVGWSLKTYREECRHPQEKGQH